MIERSSAFYIHFMNWRDLLLELRLENGLTQKEMAQLLKIGVGTWRKIEKGEIPKNLRLDIVFEIERVFGVSIYQQFRER